MNNDNLDTEQPNIIQRFFSENTSFIFSIISLLIIVIGSFIFLVFGSWHFSRIIDEAKIAQYGDFIGGITGPLFSLVGVILFYVALTEQRKDIQTNQEALSTQVSALNQQLIEFQAQRQELESTRKIYEQQTRTMRIQQFDSSFYSLLNVFIQLKHNLNSSGIDYFTTKYTELIDGVEILTSDTFIESNRKTDEVYTKMFLNDRSLLSHYFKTLYRLLKIVSDCDDFDTKQQEFYSKIIRSQITDSELIILYYNLFSLYGKDARPIMSKFKMLKHLRTLSKVEFLKKFNFSDESVKIHVTIFNEWLAELIDLNLLKAKDIEANEIKSEENYLPYQFIVGVYIDAKMELKIYIDNQNISLLPFSEPEFSDFILMTLYDILYLNKLKTYVGNEISKSITKTDSSTQFNYSITNDGLY
jgi:hypothetical protein